MNKIEVYLGRLFLFTYLVVITLLTAVRGDLSVHSDEISKLLVGKYSSWAILVFVLLSLGTMLLARIAIEGSQRQLGWLLAIYAACVLIAGLTKPTQAVHDIASLIAFLIIPIAAFRQAKSYKPQYYWLSGMMLSMLCWPLLGFGYGERITVYIEIAWLLWLTFTLKKPFAEK